MSNNYKLVEHKDSISDLLVVKPEVYFDHRGENFEGFFRERESQAVRFENGAEAESFD